MKETINNLETECKYDDKSRKAELEKPNIAIVMPAYNESSTIEACINEFHSAAPDAKIVVIDNNSNDGTGELAESTFRNMKIDGYVIYEPLQGKGNAVRRAFIELDSDIFVLVDADTTYPANQILELVQPIMDGRADMVVGDRHGLGCYFRENKRRFHEFGNNLVKRIVNILFSSNLSDIMSGYRAMSRTFVKNYPGLVKGFELETDLTLYALNGRFRIIETPIQYKDRPPNSHSKLSTFSDGAKVLFVIAQVLRHYQPLRFFGSISIILFILGLIAAIPVINDWISGGYIYHVPLAILATGLEIVSVISLAIGLILDSVSYQQNIGFERSLRLKRQ